METKMWKIQMRLGKDRDVRISTRVLSKSGDFFVDEDLCDNRDEVAFIVQNHLASAEKTFQTQLMLKQSAADKASQ
jgi:hypothetical protein